MKSKLHILTVLFLLILMKFASTENKILGPVSVRVLMNSTVRLQCQVQLSDIFHQIKVQWLKDGFGFENETLRGHFNNRYIMPGPKSNGTYDLIIYNVERIDDAEYACQVNAANHNKPSSSILKTTKAINMTVVVPPKTILLRFQAYLSESSKADYVSNKPTSMSREPDGLILQNSKQITNLWGKINEFVSLVCEVTKSRPAAKLKWMLGQYEFFQNLAGDFGSVYSTTKFIDQQEQFYNRTRSYLKLKLKEEHNNEILKCFVDNPSDFLNYQTSVIHIKLNVLYITDVQLNVEPKRIYFRFRENEAIHVTCDAKANPNNVTYIWIRYNANTERTFILKESTLENSIQIRLTRYLNDQFIRCLVIATIPRWYLDLLEEENIQQFYGSDNRPCLIPRYPIGTEVFMNSFQLNCSANKYDTMFGQIPLRVIYSPSIIGESLETKAGFIGDIISLNCTVDANPIAALAWYKSSARLQDILQPISGMTTDDRASAIIIDESQESPSISPVYHTNTAMKLITMNSNHQFTITDPNKSGLFVCIAKSSGFPNVYKYVYVTRGGPPRIINSHHQRIIAKLGSTVRIPCRIISIPIPTKQNTQWFKGKNQYLINYDSGDSRYKITRDIKLAGIISYLTIRHIRNSDYDVYNCSSTNKYGQIFASYEIIAPDQPPLIFIIGSSSAIILAIVFSFIIFYIIRSAKINRAANINRNHANYTKGNFLDLNNVSNDINNNIANNTPTSLSYYNEFQPDQISLHQLNNPMSIGMTNNSYDFMPMLPNRCGSPASQKYSMFYKTPISHNNNNNSNFLHQQTLPLSLPASSSKSPYELFTQDITAYHTGSVIAQSPNLPCLFHQSPNSPSHKLFETPNTPPEGTNESSRSYDSGVCPDDSGYISGARTLPFIYNTSSNVYGGHKSPVYSKQQSYNIQEHLPDVTEFTNGDSVTPSHCSPSHVPVFVAYSPTSLAKRALDWTSVSQTTKL